MIPNVTVADLEVGPRAVFGMARENNGLTAQRIAVIKGRRPDDWLWTIHYGDDGMASRISIGQARSFS